MAQEEKFELVSSLMDDECSEEEWDAAHFDLDMQLKWDTYHLIRECMQKSNAACTQDRADFVFSESFRQRLSETVQDAVSEEKVASSVPVAANNTFFAWFSVAASVAAVGVAMWQLWPMSKPNQAVVTAQQDAKPAKSNMQGQAVVPVAVKPANVVESKDGVVVPNVAAQNQSAPEVQSAVQVQKAASQEAASSVQ